MRLTNLPENETVVAARNPQQTRQRLLQTAFAEMHAHGFQGMRIDEVLKRAELQKGAFYHHFGSKTELGYTVLDEVISAMIEAVWIAPLGYVVDPVRDIPKMLETLGTRIPEAIREHGCPLNNLAQEMATQDDGFRERVAAIFNHWIDAFTETFVKAKKNGYIREDVDCRMASRYIIATLEGCISIYKIEKSMEQWKACRSQITGYLSTLRPDA